MTPRPFPLPVVAATTTADEDAPAEMMAMPRDMGTFQAPSLPEPEQMAAHRGALQVLQSALAALNRLLDGETVAPIDLGQLDDANRALVNQVLGEGEVSAQVLGENGVQAQESVFAGVWRVLELNAGWVVRDTIELGAIPQAIVRAAAEDGRQGIPEVLPVPGDTMNAPAILEELRDRARTWQPGQQAHVINLTLLPLVPGDSEYLQARLATGRVMILSRGYGNCRIVNTRLARTWRVTYFNSQDLIILDTLEVGPVPEAACAARQDLEDSAERLAEVLQWVEQG